MTFVVRLVDHKEAVAVAHLIEHRRVRIVAGPDGVKIILLHEHQIPLHVRHVRHRSRDGVGIMPVHPAELDRPVVDEDPVPVDPDLPQSHSLCDDLFGGSQDQRVQIRRLAVPEDRVRDAAFAAAVKGKIL